MANPIRIYSFPLSGHSHRVQLLASLAGINHELVFVDLRAGEHKKPAFLALNPAGQVPVVEDNGVVVTDSNAILVYLAKKYAPSFLPTDALHEAEVQKFLSLAAGEIAFGPAAARLITVFNAPLDIKTVRTTTEKALAKLENHMIGREFLVGDSPSIADVAIYTYTAHAPEGNISLDLYPNVKRLLKNIETLKGFVPMAVTKVGLAA